jgi:Lysylphosphatidylglycerol synthase TM region
LIDAPCTPALDRRDSVSRQAYERSAARFASALGRCLRARGVRVGLTVTSAILGVGIAAVAARYFAETSWPLLRAHPGLLVAAGALSLLGYVFKAYGWRQLVATNERPPALALAAANGGASITGLALPGRFDDVVRIAIVRRFRGCPAGVRTLCLSVGMLGLVDSAAMAPLALTSAVLPGHSLGVRLVLLFLAAVGIAAAAFVFALSRLAGGRRLLRYRFGRWLSPRTTSFGDASLAWTFLSAGWIVRISGVIVVLGALGVGFSFTLALLYVCASWAAAALPIGPGGTATQAGAGAAVLIASGVGIPEAVGVAVAVQLVGILIGGSIFVSAVAWRAGGRLVPRHRDVPSTVGI